MKRENWIKVIPILLIALMILARNLREGGYEYWSYVCYAVIVALAVYSITSKSLVGEDGTRRKRQRLIMGLALLTVVILFILQYLQIVQ